MRKTALVKSALAEAEPVPLTFANLTTKSFVFIYLIHLTINHPNRNQDVAYDGGQPKLLFAVQSRFYKLSEKEISSELPDGFERESAETT
jgi:hypothetical protein